jgi:hypothetical protein
MSCLVYGIVFPQPQSRADAPLSLPLGVGGAPVGLIEGGNLAAAVATIDRAALTPTVGSVTAYARVVEVLHADRAVLPMRYGCVLGGEADVIQLLHARGETYAEVLRGLEGCVEMGIRMLVGKAACGGDGNPGVQNPEFTTGASGRFPGTAYLTRRQSVYAEADRHAHEIARSVEWIRVAFDGLFLRCKRENCPTATRSLSSDPLFSIYFLVRRESIESFRQVFHGISRTEHGRLLLSGPWPPYNFIGPEHG